MDQPVERLAEVRFEDTVYDDAIMAQEAVEVRPSYRANSHGTN
jgi:hypothetical protein